MSENRLGVDFSEAADTDVIRRFVEALSYSRYLDNIPVEPTAIATILASLGVKDSDVQVLSTTDPGQVESLPADNYACIVNLDKINDIRPLNEFLSTIHRKLQHGGYFVGVVELMATRYKNLWDRYPDWMARVLYWLDYTRKRVIPGLLPHNNRIVHAFIFNDGRVMSKTEVLGRLVYSGFSIDLSEEVEGSAIIVAQKSHSPSADSLPATGPLLKLNRSGQNGETISVYKLRTMHPYAQYLQEYVYVTHGLREGGKLAEDFRIAPWGKTIRALWLDEIPMLINVLKGELKLVGVRPLSNHYMSLYTPDHRARRYEHKPGLFPPFYADLPQTIEEIMVSEAKYFDAYDQAPIRTDIKYLLFGLYNILVKRARSK